MSIIKGATFITIDDVSILKHVDTSRFSLDIFTYIEDEDKYGFSLICKDEGNDFICHCGFKSPRSAWFSAFQFLENYRGVDSDEYPLPRGF